MGKKLVVIMNQGYQLNELYRKFGIHQTLAILTWLPGQPEFKCVAHSLTSSKRLPRLIGLDNLGEIIYLPRTDEKLILKELSGVDQLSNTSKILENIDAKAPNIRKDFPYLESFMDHNTKLSVLGNIKKLAFRENQYVTNAQVFDVKDYEKDLNNLYNLQCPLPSTPECTKFSLRNPADTGVDHIMLAHTEGSILRPANIIEFYCEFANKLIELNSKNKYLGYESCAYYDHALNCILEGRVEYFVCLNDCDHLVLDLARYPIFNEEVMYKAPEIANILLGLLSKCYSKI